MANMCSNYITITGDDLTKIRELLEKAKQDADGWLPDGMEGGWLFGIYMYANEDDLIIFECESKWSPPTEELEAIGKLCKVNITNQYEELGSYEYGQSDFRIDTMQTVITCLDEEDIQRVTEYEDLYKFNDEIYESRYDAYEQMLQEKIKKQNRTYMAVDVSGRGFTTTHTFSQLKNWLGEEMTCDDELAIDAIDSLDVGDKFDCDNIIDSDSFTACHIIRTT
jgi:hypothetical protein